MAPAAFAAALSPGRSGSVATSVGAGEGVGDSPPRRRRTATPTAPARTSADAAPRPTRTGVPSPPRRAGDSIAVGAGETSGCGGRVGGAAGAGTVRAETTVGAAGRGTARVGTLPMSGNVRASRPASRAATKAPALGHRSSGFLAVHLRSARRSGSGTVSGDGSGRGSCTCFMRMATGVSAEKGTRPVNIS